MAPDTDINPETSNKPRGYVWQQIWFKMLVVQLVVLLAVGPSVLILNEYKHAMPQTTGVFQATMGQVILLALVLAVILTFYILYLVTHPLRQLTQAVGQLRDTQVRTQTLPDLSARGDEVGALSTALRTATGDLIARLNGIERFAADVAHELKNPLTSLRSALETLPLIHDQDKRQRLYDIMIEDTNRLNRLITDIARISKLDVNLAREETLPVDLRMAIRQALRGYAKGDALLSGQLPNRLPTLTRGIEIALEIPDNLPRVRGNILRLQQVFDNLIDNAISFSPNNGAVTLSCRVNNGWVLAFIDDRGPGIPDAKRETIFERFYSERPGSEAFGTHSGLGLAIAKQIVDAIGGKIYAENRVTSDGAILGARLVVELKVA